MKSIYILRHAKSSWQYFDLEDIQRPLNKRGYQSATLIGNFLKTQKVTFDKILTSPATRTLSTAQIIATNVSFPIKNIEIVESFYEFSDNGQCIFDVLKTLPSEIKSIAVFGHNSTLQNIVNRVSNYDVLHFPTGAVMRLKFNNSDWSKLNLDNVEFIDSIKPKDIDPDL